jgi:hypothetical protein
MMRPMRYDALIACLTAGLAMLPATGIAAGPSVLAQARTDTGPNLAAQAPAPPRPGTVAILILSGEEAGLALSNIYSDARKAIEGHTAMNVAPLDAIGLAEREAAIRECAGKADCFARKVRINSGAIDQLLTVSVDRLDQGLLLGFRLVDVKTEQELGATGDEVPVGMSMFGAMEQQLAQVFPTTVWNQIAAVTIQTEPANAEVSIGGRACASPCELKRMIPGTYEVTIKKAGYVPWTGTVTLTPDRAANVNTILAEPAGGITSSPLFWGAIGAAVVGAGVATFFLLRPSDRSIRLCIAPTEDVCPM